MAKIIYDSQLGDFLADLSKEAVVYAPIHSGKNQQDQINFLPWKHGTKLALNYPSTILPPKSFLLPNGEPLFSYSDGLASSIKSAAQIIFGLSLEDLEGINKLDKVMSKPISDVPYEMRRGQTYLVGLDKYSPPVGLDFDLYLQEIQPGVFSATAKTTRGKRWLTAKYFKNHQISIPRVTKKSDPLLSDPLLPKAIKDSAKSPVWDELAEICFGCGICSYVCPLCYCFETEDKTEFGDQLCGERCRQWDSCMLKNFAATNNHNFRPELRDRIYNWYHHKFYRMPRESGFSGCVDCNRCTVYCPAKINYRRVLSRVLTDYQKRPKK